LRYRQFGRTGLYVSELCLGAMTFGGGEGMWSVVGGIGQTDADAILRRSLDAGINFIDTASTYSDGKSEEILGQGLRNLGVRRSDVVLATKVYGATAPGPNHIGASRSHILETVKDCLRRLQTDYIDLYQIHHDDPVTPVEETVRALDDLVRQGLVRYVGVSNWPAWKMMKAIGVAEHRGWARFESAQAYYSLVGRDLEWEIAPFLQAERLGLMVYSPLASGLLSGKFGPGAENPKDARRAKFDFPPVDQDYAWKCVAVLREIAASKGTSVARTALAWLLAKPVVTSVIIGARRLDQLDDNLGAVDLALTAEEIARLDAVSAQPAPYPAFMLARQGPARIPQPFTPKA